MCICTYMNVKRFSAYINMSVILQYTKHEEIMLVFRELKKYQGPSMPKGTPPFYLYLT